MPSKLMEIRLGMWVSLYFLFNLGFCLAYFVLLWTLISIREWFFVYFFWDL